MKLKLSALVTSAQKPSNAHAVLFLLLLLATVGSFQNCSYSIANFQELVSDLTPSTNASSGDGAIAAGNGEGYEGKPTGTFYRLVPNQNCIQPGHALSHFSRLEISSSENKHTWKKPGKTCDLNSEVLTDKDLVYSSTQSQVIGFKDGLFVSEKWQKQQPERTVEAWCSIQAPVPLEVGNSSLIPRDIVFYAADTTNLAIGRSWTTTQWQDHKYARNFKGQILNFKSGQLEFEIDLREVASSKHIYPGKFLTNGASNKSGVTYACRIGQKLDGVIWPSVLLDIQRTNIRFLHSSASFLYSTPFKNNLSQLRRFNYLTGDDYPLTEPMSLNKESSFVISSNDRHVFFTKGKDNSPEYHLFSQQLAGGHEVQLSRYPLLDGTSVKKCAFHGYSPKYDRVFFTEHSSKQNDLLTSQFCYMRANSADGTSYQKLIDEQSTSDGTNRTQLNDVTNEFIFERGPYANNNEWLVFNQATRETKSLGLDFTLIQASYQYVPPTTSEATHQCIYNRTEDFYSGSSLYIRESNAAAPMLLSGPGHYCANTQYNPGSANKAVQDDFQVILKNNAFATNASSLGLGPILPGPLETLSLYRGTTREIRQIASSAGNKGLGWFSQAAGLVAYTVADSGFIAPTTSLTNKLHIFNFDDNSEHQASLTGIRFLEPVGWIDNDSKFLLKAGTTQDSLEFLIYDLKKRVFNKIPNLPIWTNLKGVCLSAYLATNCSISIIASYPDRIFVNMDIDSDGLGELFVLYLDGRGYRQLNNRYEKYGGPVLNTDIQVINAQTVLFETTAPRTNASSPAQKHLFLWKEEIQEP